MRALIKGTRVTKEEAGKHVKGGKSETSRHKAPKEKAQTRMKGKQS